MCYGYCPNPTEQLLNQNFDSTLAQMQTTLS